MEKKKIQVWLPLLFSITMIAGIFLGYKMRDEIPGKSFFSRERRRPVEEVMDLIRKKYVDTVDMNMLADTAIQAMLLKLDPHSVFIPARELDMVNEEITGSFFGIGIEFNIFNDSLHVVNVIKGGPSEKAGLKTGDQILKADGMVISGKKISTDSIRSILRGPLGSVVNIELLRGAKIIRTQIQRDVIPISSLDAAYMADSITGYIRLNKFSQQTYREFMISLESLKKQGMKKLVFDLRGNGGGILDEAVEIADEFLDGDKLITYTIGAHVAKKEYRCRREGQFETGELVVLADEGTASASEVIIGALQDWGRATIIGRRTFGKGLVQDQFDLSDKSALRLTIARYYTPIGRSIQRSYAGGGKAYYDEITLRMHNGDSTVTDSARLQKGKVFITAKGKKVYGGGGITPDLYIQADTALMSKALTGIYQKNLAGDFGYTYYLNNRSIESRFKSPKEFTTAFNLDDNGWKLFEGIALKDSIDISGISIKEKDYLAKALKAAIARQLWRNEGYFEVYNTSDDAVQKALLFLKQ